MNVHYIIISKISQEPLSTLASQLSFAFLAILLNARRIEYLDRILAEGTKRINSETTEEKRGRKRNKCRR